jgi:hypothetical protein
MLWPYFGNIKVTIQTNDGDIPQCRMLEAKDIEIKVSFIIKNLKADNNDPLANIEQVIFKLMFDYLKTPPRNKRVLLD